jgi:hypothetical protein
MPLLNVLDPKNKREAGQLPTNGNQFMLSQTSMIRSTKRPLEGVQGPEIGCRGWIRTNDLQVMSLTSYQAAPPCNKGRGTVLAVMSSVNAFS